MMKKVEDGGKNSQREFFQDKLALKFMDTQFQKHQVNVSRKSVIYQLSISSFWCSLVYI